GDDTLAPGLPEACNGRDDDCDEECDEDFECCRGESRGCATSCGSTGQRVCNDACALGECIPPEEQCNGTDDDCDGPCDEDFECCLGLATECVTTCGSRGSQECVDGCVLADCVPPDETCNGVDDDCDGDADEGFPCEAGTSVSCTTTCASTGSRTCDASCALGACVPPPESCGNSVDDDCNGMIDEGCMSMCNQSCGGATAVTGTGGRFVQTLVAGTNNGSCGGTGGVETVFTFTTTTVSDVFITTHGSPGIDTVVYVRACRCAGPERACNDDADGLVTSALRLPDLAAGTYNVFVDSRSTTPVAATVDIYITPTGADGDRCGRVLPLTIPATTGNNCGLTSDVNGSCEWPESLNGPDRVYYLTVPPGPARMVTFDTSTGCTDYDTSIDLRRSCAGTGMLGSLGCDDDGVRSSCSPTDFQSRLSLSLEPGVYYLNVDGYGTSCGNYTLTTTGL
ncbi:MAG: hypothetical protein IT379_15420, partial [Deltaproteobacteria bacterium]|nr:hypothetical protein [Deltaproteobacteria bacterium]